MKHFSFIVLFSIALASCDTDSQSLDQQVGVVTGYEPIYADSSDYFVSLQDPRPIEHAGKIYSYQNLLMVNEAGKGIHIYNNSDPANPVNLSYISIPGNNDVAIKNGILYADSFGDLLALEVTMDTVIIHKRIEGILDYSVDLPPVAGTYFECVDDSKGFVIGWVETELENPKCFRQ
ncbi:MAG: hypothetical protein RIC35_18865 [Marinoscillum sp.]